jgi:putative OmpL-like beta-barrel porin-2
VPDIEAQLAPNNYMYSHSFTYGFDNYTNTGIVTSTQLDKNWIVQLGLVNGTDTSIANTHAQDPGVQPTGVFCVRWSSTDSKDSWNGCANGINNGVWGYNNLQWLGFTYYHKFNDQWHLATEFYSEHQNQVPDVNNADLQSPLSGIVINGPNHAVCPNGKPFCTANANAALAYLNYQFAPLDNLTWRAELYDDQNGQRTGTKTRYFNYAFGWQHWFSPSVTFRPEIAWYNSLDAPAFDSGTKSKLTVVSADLIWHF